MDSLKDEWVVGAARFELVIGHHRAFRRRSGLQHGAVELLHDGFGLGTAPAQRPALLLVLLRVARQIFEAVHNPPSHAAALGGRQDLQRMAEFQPKLLDPGELLGLVVGERNELGAVA